MRKIIIDTDPGIDDAFAIIAAFKYEGFEVLGITSVAGNKGVKLTTENSQKLTEFMKASCKVYKGNDEPLDNRNKLIMMNNNVTNDEIHGKDGLGDVDLGFHDKLSLGKLSAVDFILEQAAKYKGELEIIALGPLTNIANAIKKDEEKMKGVKTIYTMGGGIEKFNKPGNTEYNYYFDPLATSIVFEFGKYIDIHMIGLDVTHKCVFTLGDLFFFGQELGETGRVLSHMASVYVKIYWNTYKYLGCVIHDLLTVLYAIDHSICPVDNRVSLKVKLDKDHCGQTVIDKDSNIINANVPLVVDVEKAKNLFVKLLDENKLDLYKRYVK